LILTLKRGENRAGSTRGSGKDERPGGTPNARVQEDAKHVGPQLDEIQQEKGEEGIVVGTLSSTTTEKEDSAQAAWEKNEIIHLHFSQIESL